MCIEPYTYIKLASQNRVKTMVLPPPIKSNKDRPAPLLLIPDTRNSVVVIRAPTMETRCSGDLTAFLPIPDTSTNMATSVDSVTVCEDDSDPVVVVRSPTMGRRWSLADGPGGVEPLSPFSPIPTMVDINSSVCDAVGGIDKPFRVCTRTTAAIDANLNFCQFLAGFSHKPEITGVENRVFADNLGTILWREDGKDTGASFAGILYLMLSTEIDNNPEHKSVAKRTIETEFGPVAKFPEILEKLAAKLLHGANLARAAGIDKVAAFDAETPEDKSE